MNERKKGEVGNTGGGMAEHPGARVAQLSIVTLERAFGFTTFLFEPLVTADHLDSLV